MSKEAFAQTIIDKLSAAIGTDGANYTADSCQRAMQAVADGITEYLIANTSVEVAYTGVIPGTPPSPDPVVADTFQIEGVCAPTGPSQSFDDWIRQIEANIIAGFALAPLGERGVAFAQMPFAITGIATSQAGLKAAHDIGDESPQLKIWSIVCGDIMDWINATAANLTPGGAARASGPSTGTASIVAITVT